MWAEEGKKKAGSMYMEPHGGGEEVKCVCGEGTVCGDR